MGNHDDPVAAAAEAAEAMRALAHATQRLDNPSDLTWTLGDVLAITSRLIQVLEQVGHAHRDHAQSAHDNSGRRTAGRAFALSAAADLHQAAITHAEAFRRLDRAAQSSGRIGWSAPEPANRTPVPLAARPAVMVDSSSRPVQDAEPGL